MTDIRKADKSARVAFPPRVETTGLPSSRLFSCTVVYQGSCPVVVGQTLGDNRIRQDIAVALGIKTALAVPIRVNNQLFGAVMLLNRLDGQELTDRDSLLVEEYLNSLLRDEG